MGRGRRAKQPYFPAYWEGKPEKFVDPEEDVKLLMIINPNIDAAGLSAIERARNLIVKTEKLDDDDDENRIIQDPNQIDPALMTAKQRDEWTRKLKGEKPISEPIIPTTERIVKTDEAGHPLDPTPQQLEDYQKNLRSREAATNQLTLNQLSTRPLPHPTGQRYIVTLLLTPGEDTSIGGLIHSFQSMTLISAVPID